jgi:hypothetical protein
MSVARFYAYRDVVLIPTVAQAEEGFYLDAEPVTICGIADSEKLKEELYAALARENPVVPTPEASDEPGSVILEALGLKKWLKFEAEAMMYTVHSSAERLEWYSTGRAVNGTWQRRQSKHMTFDADEEGTKMLVNSVISDIAWEQKAAAEAESQNKSGGLMLLPGPTEKQPES